MMENKTSFPKQRLRDNDDDDDEVVEPIKKKPETLLTFKQAVSAAIDSFLTPVLIPLVIEYVGLSLAEHSRSICLDDKTC